MRKLILLLCFVFCLLPAAASAGYTITAIPFNATGQTFTNTEDIDVDYTSVGDRVQLMEFSTPIGTTINFTLYYGSGSSVSGWIIYRQEPGYSNFNPYSYSEIALNGVSSGFSFLDVYDRAVGRIDLAGYARNDSSASKDTGILIYDRNNNLGLHDQQVFYPIADIGHNTIHRVVIHASQPTNVVVFHAPADQVAQAAGKSLTDAVYGYAEMFIQYGQTIWDYVTAGFLWFKLVFIDNFVLTALFIIVGSLAVAVGTSHDVFTAFRKWFGWVRSFIEFTVGLAQTLINILVRIIEAVVPWK